MTQTFARAPAALLEIALRDDAERADGGEHPAFRAVDLVHAVAFLRRPAVTASWQVDGFVNTSRGFGS